MHIALSYDYNPCSLEGFGFEPLAHFVLEQEECPVETEVSISFVSNDVIAQLNETYRSKKGPTDVLSFECDGLDDEFELTEGRSDRSVPFELGDIIIAPDVAAAQCADYGNTLQQELELLLTHGLLHLCGYDHIEDDEAEEMEARERELLSAWRGNPA